VNTLVLESAPLAKEQEARLLQRFPVLDRIVYLEKIPQDKRHNSKVLYAELERQLLTGEKGKCSS
jgi:hypothetical protein